MTDSETTPFDNIESAHEYVALLAEAIDEAVSEIAEEMRAPGAEGRRLQALQLVAYKLDRLRGHMAASRRLLNDLRTLRRLLLGERLVAQPRPAALSFEDEILSERPRER
jgi:hypothetical protein